MKPLLFLILLVLGLALAQTASKVTNQALPVQGAVAIKTFDDRVLRALAVSEGKRCQVSEGWSYAKASQDEYRKLVDGFSDGLKKAGWQVESKGQLAQGGSTVEAYKFSDAKSEAVIAYWLLAKGSSQLYWCRLG